MKINLKKSFYLLQITLLCLFICSCSVSANKASNTIKQMIQAASSDDIEVINELAPFTKAFGIEEISAYLSFWKNIAEKNHNIKVVQKTDNEVFVKVTVLTEYKTTIVSYIFICQKNDGNYILTPNYKIDSSKRKIDLIELKDLENND